MDCMFDLNSEDGERVQAAMNANFWDAACPKGTKEPTHQEEFQAQMELDTAMVLLCNMADGRGNLSIPMERLGTLLGHIHASRKRTTIIEAETEEEFAKKMGESMAKRHGKR